MLHLSIAERVKMRSMGGVQQEWFLATRFTKLRLETELYTATHSLDGLCRQTARS